MLGLGNRLHGGVSAAMSELELNDRGRSLTLQILPLEEGFSDPRQR
jgi:hypothetical protein